ncbi:MAG: IS110 family transposase [Actinomycetia bacterium]|nr:IS110 family transposase [Actinomycetes bacterium]
MIFVGNDWAEAHHDVWVMDEDGDRLAYRRLSEGIEGVSELHELVSGFASDPAEVVVGIETDRGLWVLALVAAGYQVYVINPFAASRYRDRHHVSGAKSDRGDAKMLADLVRTDRHLHRQVAGDTPEAETIKVLARTHQTMMWEKRRHVNRLRSMMREYYPAALEAFKDLAHRDAIAVLSAAPTPTAGARLTKPQIRAALKKGGRQRNLDRRTVEIQGVLRSSHLATAPRLEEGFGTAATAILAVIATIDIQIAELEAELAEAFHTHPDAAIYLSMPGLADVLGARILGEFGDDPNRYATAKSRRNYAGTSPLTRASGNTKTVTVRYIGNDRLKDAALRWAFTSLGASEGSRIYYDERRAKGDHHRKALRALANRLVGILHGCLEHQVAYDEDIAWAHRQPIIETIAA